LNTTTGSKQHPHRASKWITEAVIRSAETDPEAAIKKLSELKGIGPATASAVLAAADPHLPFMSDELMQVLFDLCLIALSNLA
jgi:endonuclease III-like uncharacterized protein